jgi:signal transduction histidine kinase
MSRPRRSSAGYAVGWLLFATAGLRVLIFYQGKPALAPAVALIAGYALLYAAEPLLSPHFRWFRFVYFPMQTGLVLALTNLRPYLDVTCQLYIALSVQALHAFGRRPAVAWLILFSILLTVTEVIGVGWGEGLALSLTMLGGAFFLISYDLLYDRMQVDQAESRALLTELQEAHRDLQAYAGQVEALTAARERNRLARELHDSVSQTIFSVTLTAQAARLLLDRDPARVPELLDRLESMTGSALAQLRSLIAKLHPPQTS